MLQAIRSQATSFVVKLLFGLLILTFGIWGIGDIFRSRGSDTTVATVGSRTISVEQLSQQVQTQLDRLRNLFGGSIDAAQAKQLGVVDQALQGLIANNLVQLEIDRLGLAVGDQAVHDAIVANPAFHDQSGGFNRNLFDQVLAANRLTAPQFEAIQRSELLRAQLTGALADGMSPPKALVDALYRGRAERRVADLLTVPASAAGQIPMPTDAQIDEYYKANPDKFQAPERRSFTVAMLQLDDLAAGIEISDDTLRHEFDQRRDEFGTPEERQLMQMLLPNEAMAKKAQDELAGGKDFAAVAADVLGNTDPKSLDLGWMKRDDLPPDLASAAFSAPEGGTTAPIKSDFGWHIFRIASVKAAAQQNFDQVKDRLKLELARERAGDRMADQANSIDDTIAGGASFEDVVKKFALKTMTAADVDAAGKDPAGKTAEFADAGPAILKTAFATDSGQTSGLSEMGDTGYFLVKVEKVDPATTQPLADVKDRVVLLWQNDERRQALQKVADEIVQDVNSGKSLKEVGDARKMSVTSSGPLQRTAKDAPIPPALVAKLFDAKKDAAVSEPGGDYITVAQLQSIEPADPTQDQNGVKSLSQQMGDSMHNDVLSEFDQALRKTFPVAVDQANVDRVM